MSALRDIEEHGQARASTGSVVYFVQAEHGGPVKIGTTKRGDVLRRLRQLQCGNAYRLRVRRIMPGDVETEAALHKHFAADRMVGEWFLPSPELVGLLEPPARWPTDGKCIVEHVVEFEIRAEDRADAHRQVAALIAEAEQDANVRVTSAVLR